MIVTGITIKRIWLFFWRRIDGVFLRLLTFFSECPPWHACSSYSSRPYKETVVRLVNGLSPKCVVEVGSGFGDIIYRVQAQERYGYDIDDGVIHIARFLHGRKVTFIKGGILDIKQESIDVLILVNWIHELTPSRLERLILPLLPKTCFLVLDSVRARNPSANRYEHDFEFLKEYAERISITPAPDEPRSFYLFKVTK